jgi:hypothetical protein
MFQLRFSENPGEEAHVSDWACHRAERLILDKNISNKSVYFRE